MAAKIFINYRRGDDPGFAGRLFDRLESAFEPEQLFMDVDSIAPGQDFVRVLEDHVAQCDVVLAVIGKGWIDASDESGRRRLDDPEDFVRIEIEAGLKLGKRVIPVLVNGAQMPRPEVLPASLVPLSRRNAVRLTHDRFKSDAHGLVKVLETALEEAATHHQPKDFFEPEGAARARVEAIQSLPAHLSLSATDISKAEELANWDFIKGSFNRDDLRDHLARFPGGVTERFAATALEDLAWENLERPLTLRAIAGFLSEFPSGRHSGEARVAFQEAEQREEARRLAEERERAEADAWAKATAIGGTGGKEGYQMYLANWPNGRFASQAKASLAELTRTRDPETIAETINRRWMQMVLEISGMALFVFGIMGADGKWNSTSGVGVLLMIGGLVLYFRE